jgi:hypothetical protein
MYMGVRDVIQEKQAILIITKTAAVHEFNTLWEQGNQRIQIG